MDGARPVGNLPKGQRVHRGCTSEGERGVFHIGQGVRDNESARNSGGLVRHAMSLHAPAFMCLTISACSDDISGT
eukprot:2506679-Pyramimonas_sp.AAC.1